MRTRILLALLIVGGTAQASEWVTAGHSDDGKVEVFVDVSSIRVGGAVRRVWVKTVYAPQRQKGRGANSNKWVHDILSRYAFNCSDEDFREEAQTQYFRDGSSWSVPAGPEYTDPWEPVAPDTLASVEMQFVCAWKSR